MAEKEPTVPLHLYEAKVKEIGKLKAKLAEQKKYQLILSIPARIEFLEEYLEIPKNDYKTGKTIARRDERWSTWFYQKQNTLVTEMENKINNGATTVDSFCKCIHLLYGDFSDRAAHRVPLPANITEEDFDRVMQQIGVYKDKPLKKALKIIILPLEDDDLKNSSSSSDSVIFQNDENLKKLSLSSDE